MIPKNNDMRFEVTTKCNYNCIMCPHDNLTRKIETMNFDLFKLLFDKIINVTDQYDTLTFPGMGEPLMDETLNKKIAYARSRKKDMPVLLLTNGSLLTLERFKELEELGTTSVRVSLYGSNKDNYAKVHGIKNKDMYERVKKNLLDIIRSKESTKLLLTLNVIDENKDGVDAWIDFWKDKADLVEVWHPHNWVDGMHYRDLKNNMLKTCGRPFNGPLQIQVDGTVNMCCFDYDGKLTLGDLKTQSLDEIFSSPIFNKIKACHESGNYENSGLICEKCDQRNSDKSDVMIYNSKFNIKERVEQISTTYTKVTK